MDLLQTFLVVISGLVAVGYILRKWIFKRKTHPSSNCDSNCGCH